MPANSPNREHPPRPTFGPRGVQSFGSHPFAAGAWNNRGAKRNASERARAEMVEAGHIPNARCEIPDETCLFKGTREAPGKHGQFGATKTEKINQLPAIGNVWNSWPDLRVSASLSDVTTKKVLVHACRQATRPLGEHVLRINGQNLGKTPASSHKTACRTWGKSGTYCVRGPRYTDRRI